MSRLRILTCVLAFLVTSTTIPGGLYLVSYCIEAADAGDRERAFLFGVLAMMNLLATPLLIIGASDDSLWARRKADAAGAGK